MNDLTNNIIEEIRHPSEVDEELPVEEIKFEEAKVFEEVPVESDEEEFSNTVTLEINKIMNELVEAPEEKLEPIEDTKVIEPVVETKPGEIEIKNISELERVENTMSDTIPFIVENVDDQIDMEEEEGSNIVLNVILIVLIIVLIAVLGLIVYYILKTKGIL